MPRTNLNDVDVQYEAVRQKLLSGEHDAVLDSPVAQWVRSSDSHMPSQLLDWSVRRVITRSYQRLKAVRGIGDAKILKLCRLLERIVPEAGLASEHDAADSQKPLVQNTDGARMQPLPNKEVFLASPSICDWDAVRTCVLSRPLGHECIGRFLPSLQDLSSTLWETPLVVFGELSFGDLCSHRGWGEKTVQGVLGIFWDLAQTLHQAEAPPHLVVAIRPKFVSEVEKWVRAKLYGDEAPRAAEIRDKFIRPIVDQLVHDGGDDIAEVVRSRLGLETAPHTLHEIGSEIGLTTEGVRQKLVKVALILEVRWPEGQYILDDLCEKVESSGESAREHALVVAAFETFYPVRRRARITTLRQLCEGEAGTAIVDIRNTGTGKQPGMSPATNKRELDGPAKMHSSGPYINEAILELLGGD